MLDMLGVNTEYADYGTELLSTIKNSGAKPVVLEHCVAEAEGAVDSQLRYLRSGVNRPSYQLGLSAKPELLAALLGQVADRIEKRLDISIERDPDLNLHRRNQAAVGDIETGMDRRMAQWGNEDAKAHDRKSVWSILAVRDSTSFCPKLCDAGSIFFREILLW
ncbi:hypothetical protein [Alcaligenes faecalis]|uniref:hypothetical protein n=1 Tax=Alcaligenes faecalis TaxID=511 RepID=UPI0024BC9438|nr:hypothetical protein [Alcaligenes faecalis]WHQ45968.1 hypothetical protein E8D21_20210 [Alcaligenes faecalis]